MMGKLFSNAQKAARAKVTGGAPKPPSLPGTGGNQQAARMPTKPMMTGGNQPAARGAPIGQAHPGVPRRKLGPSLPDGPNYAEGGRVKKRGKS
ncbi:hypothetical protein ABTK44_19215, partial [Acinetobacter baumannii]